MRTVGLIACLGFWLSGCSVTVDATPNQTCTVGKAGTDLQITYSGPNANDSCSAFVQADSSHYAVDPPDNTGALICRYTIGKITVTVRDKGVLKLEGNAACDNFKAQAGA